MALYYKEDGPELYNHYIVCFPRCSSCTHFQQLDPFFIEGFCKYKNTKIIQVGSEAKSCEHYSPDFI